MARSPSFVLCIILALITLLAVGTDAFWHEQRDYTVLEEDDLRIISEALTPEVSDAILDFHNPSSLLAKMLIPRPVGSQNLTDVHNLIRKHFDALSTKASSSLGDFQTWERFEDTFTDNTPYGKKEFTNLVFTHNPKASRKLVIAAHTDSKYFVGAPANGFVGATDSAVPCAIMLAVASALTPLLDRAISEAKDTYLPESSSGTTIQLVFLDGEEAFKQWTSTDSIYGARCVIAINIIC
jgi:glutaminyl-peptide cyclotransferase